MSEVEKKLKEFAEYLKKINHYTTAGNLMYWDMTTGMPEAMAESRAETLSFFQTEVHSLNVSPKIAEFIDIPLEIIDIDVLEHDDVTSNPSDRCYYCKHHVFTTISEQAKRDGFSILCDGTNASDEVEDRPGMKAIAELSVKSPLRDCGLTKSMIRQLAKQANLFTWDKPSYACLATRFQAGQHITGHDLEHIEKAEGYLFSLGLSDFRVRLIGNTAKIQVPENQIAIVIKNRIEILTYFKSMFDEVVLDLEVRS